MWYTMLKITEKNTIHFTRSLKNTTTHVMTIFSFLCWLFCCDDKGWSNTICILQHCTCMPVLPCVCSINRTFMPYKAYVPEQSIVFVCIVSGSYQKMLFDLPMLFVFIFLQKYRTTYYYHDTDQEYIMISLPLATSPVQFKYRASLWAVTVFPLAGIPTNATIKGPNFFWPDPEKIWK